MLPSTHFSVICEVFQYLFTPLNWYQNTRKVTLLHLVDDVGMSWTMHHFHIICSMVSWKKHLKVCNLHFLFLSLQSEWRETRSGRRSVMLTNLRNENVGNFQSSKVDNDERAGRLPRIAWGCIPILVIRFSYDLRFGTGKDSPALLHTELWSCEKRYQ